MSNERELSRGLDAEIKTTHERFAVAMEERLREMAVDTKERYFAVLAALVQKLETPEKSLREVLREVMAEAAGVIFAELGRED